MDTIVEREMGRKLGEAAERRCDGLGDIGSVLRAAWNAVGDYRTRELEELLTEAYLLLGGGS